MESRSGPYVALTAAPILVSTPIDFSARADAWLDGHPAEWIREWLFELAEGGADLGPQLPGYQPDVYSCIISSPEGLLVAVLVAALGDGYTILKFDDLQED